MRILSRLPPNVRLPLGRFASRALTTGRGIRWAISPPVGAQHTENSILVSAIEEVRIGSQDRLFDLILTAASRARQTDLDSIAKRRPHLQQIVSLWPGEHYRFLAALAAEIEPRTIVEIGTDRGMGALALRSGLPAGHSVITFDVVPWASISDTLLVEQDFSEGIEQRIGDLSDETFFNDNVSDLDGALIFIDARKAVGLEFERRLLELLRLHLRKPTLLVFDDIRLLSMVEFWRTLDLPKFDATSLAHWTGTGLVELNPHLTEGWKRLGCD